MIGKKGKTIILTLLFILIFCNFSYAAPLAESYYYPAAGVYKDMDVISSYISNSGYDSRVYEDTHGYYVRRTMNSDAIFYITTHGAIDPITKSGGGKINCYNSYGVQTSTVSAESIPLDDDNYSLKAYFGSNTSALNTIRLAYFSGCQTGVTHDEWGNLLTKSNYYGALCAVGFMQNISITQSNLFDKQFFYYASKGYDINTSLSKALNDVKIVYGNSTGSVDSYQTSFKSGASWIQYLTPAKYGYQQ